MFRRKKEEAKPTDVVFGSNTSIKGSIGPEYHCRTHTDHDSVKSMCEWKGLVVTAFTHKYLKFWKPNGLYVGCCGDYGENLGSDFLINWDDMLVSNSIRGLVYWKILFENSKIELVSRKKYKGHSYIASGVIWNNLLHTGDSNGHIKVWDKNGKMLHRYTELHPIGNLELIVFQDWLCTSSQGSFSSSIRCWKKVGEGYGLECVHTFCGNSESRLNHMCCFGEQLFALCGATIHVWKKNSRESVKVVDVWNPAALAVWHGKIACATTIRETKLSLVAARSRVSTSPMPWVSARLYLFNMDGTTHSSVEWDTESYVVKLLVCDDNLWYSCGNETRILMGSWKIKRVLWIGWMKNNKSECKLATLPKEILSLIISFL